MNCAIFICLLFVALIVAQVRAGEPNNTIRAITDAESVIAVYREDWGLDSAGKPAIIFAAWPDGHVVWSGDRLNGGAPYHAGHVEPKKIAALLTRFEKDGLLADKELNRAHFGPDSLFITILIKSGQKQVKMMSWHELFERSGRIVVTGSGGAEVLESRRRLDVLRKEPADYLFFRFVWSETRAKLAELNPCDSSASVGTPVMKAGVLSWQESAPKARQVDSSDASTKKMK
jgi:hypothetical protein